MVDFLCPIHVVYDHYIIIMEIEVKMKKKKKKRATIE